jgi:hypothetical protein
MEILDLDSQKQGADWRTRFGLVITAGWLVLGLLYISVVVGWTDFVFQQAPALGSFLEGAFAPLAFLWLVVGFFLQQQLLQENTRTIQAQLEQMRRTNAQVEAQTQAIAADELHSRQDTFLRVNDLVSEQLGIIAGWIVTSYTASSEETAAQWRRMGAGDHTAFSIDIIRRCLTGEIEARELLHGTEIRASHTRRFIDAFEQLLASAGECDPYDLIVTALRDGTHGRVYRIMIESRPEPAAGPDSQA